MESVVKTLVDGWLDPTIPLANLTHLSDFPWSVITDAEAIEVAFSVQAVDFSERSLKRRASLRSMQVPHIDLVSLQSLKGLFKRNAKMFWSVCDFDVWSEVETGGFQ